MTHDETPEGFSAVGDVLARGLWPDGSRHPIVRTGDRQPIPNHVRSAVWYRDRGQCELCATGELAKPWELDHIVPWSAGGSDTTTNLRVLCEQHNQDRGNSVDPYERPRRPATWWCLNCFSADHDWLWTKEGMPLCPIHRGGFSRCRVTSGWLRVKELFGEMNDWHQRPTIVDATAVAYCAHCNMPALTDQPL